MSTASAPDLDRSVLTACQRGDREAFLDNELARYTPQLRRYGHVMSLLDPRPQVKAEEFPPTHAVTFKARDGLDLVGYLTVPKHRAMKDLPLIVLPHGGPHGGESA